MQKEKILFLLFLLPLFVFMASGERPSSGSGEFIGKVMNFLLLFGGLIFLLRKPIGNFLKQRVANIDQEIKEAERLKSEAENRLKEVRVRLESIESEMKEIKEKGEKEGRQEKGKIISAAQKEAKRMREAASQEIEMIFGLGIQELKEHTAELAIAKAREKIQKELNQKKHVYLIDKSIERLGTLYEKSNTCEEIRPGTP